MNGLLNHVLSLHFANKIVKILSQLPRLLENTFILGKRPIQGLLLFLLFRAVILATYIYSDRTRNTCVDKVKNI